MGRSRDAWHSARLRIIPTFLSFTLSACVWIAISTYRTNLTRAMMNEPKQTVPMCESSVRVADFVILVSLPAPRVDIRWVLPLRVSCELVVPERLRRR